MIVLPAIPAIVAALTPIVKAALVSAGIGAAVSGGIGAVGGAVEGYREQGEINREVLADTAYGAWNGAKDGALIGGVFGPVGLIVGPVVAPAVQIVDDFVGPVMQVVDDAVRPVVQAADDSIRPVFNRIGTATHSAAMSSDKVVYDVMKNVRNGAPPSIQKLLPKAKRHVGYGYVMDDTASGARKIGMSVDPKTRLNSVKSPSGAKPKILCTIPTYNMKALEDSLHLAYASQNLPNTGAGREWFSLSASQVKTICN